MALSDRYRLEREIGAGGMATVFLAEELRHQRPVAVKVLRPELSAALGHDRFRRELTTAAGVRHPHIVPLYDSGEAAGFLFYVVPFVEGESLRDRLAREGPLPIEDALRFTDEIASALSYAHGRGILHRCLTPDRILLEHGHAMVADVGIAQAVSAASDATPVVASMDIATPTYTSPEQSSGAVIDARSDLYALGCIVYEMLAGSPPFTGPTATALMVRHAIEPVPNLGARRANVPKPVIDAIEGALAKSPADRFASVEEWRRALARASGGHHPASAAQSVPVIARAAPTADDALLGREAVLAQAIARVRAGARVLSLTGAAGTGTSRVAIELFTQLQNNFPHGAAYVSLAAVSEARGVMPTISTALGIAEAHGRSALDAIATVIGGGRTLLLLDNMEHARDSAADIAELVSRCSGVCVITTSRAPLAIGIEHELAVPTLAVPDMHVIHVDALLPATAVELFVQRAVKAQPAFALTTANRADVAAICLRLDGLPLALELAAARLRLFEPAALRQQLDDAIDLPTADDHDVPARQRTLRATIAWSDSLLSTAEQQLLRSLSVFADGWALAAMEAVCYAEADQWRARDELRAL